MPSMPEEWSTLREPVLRELIRATADVSALVFGQKQGFAVKVRLGSLERVLVTSRGSVRLFASLDTAGSFVRSVGISRFEVDMTAHEPGRLRKPRPDRAEALKGTRTRLRQEALEFRT